MKISKNIETLQELIKNSQFSDNSNPSVGGLEAIMQAMSCKNKIGWRVGARRLLIFSSDASFNYTVDGQNMTPNCRLNENSSTTLITSDTSSIARINEKLSGNHINVIFAVTQSVQDFYWKLSSEVMGSSAGLLLEDSSNVAELMKYEYNVGFSCRFCDFLIFLFLLFVKFSNISENFIVGRVKGHGLGRCEGHLLVKVLWIFNNADKHVPWTESW
jgi:hypothetical protein